MWFRFSALRLLGWPATLLGNSQGGQRAKAEGQLPGMIESERGMRVIGGKGWGQNYRRSSEMRRDSSHNQFLLRLQCVGEGLPGAILVVKTLIEADAFVAPRQWDANRLCR